MHRVFLADQDLCIAQSLAAGLTELGYSVEVIDHVADAASAARSSCPNVALIARGQPMVMGSDVVRQIENEEHTLPMLLITDRQSGAARAGAMRRDELRTGSVRKPFVLAQIAARLQLHLDSAPEFRRSDLPVRMLERAPILQVADLLIERNSRRVSRAGIPIETTRQEYLLLEYLALHHDVPVTREMIARDVWSARNRATSLDNVIGVHVSHLRGKLAAVPGSPLIHTIRGMGYMMSARKP